MGLFEAKREISFASYSDVGDREVNEDYVAIKESDRRKMFVLCDGLGGHGMGDKASSLVGTVFGEVFGKCTDDSKFIAEAFECAQKTLMDEQKKNNATRKMKTTCVAMVTDEKSAYIGHIGDSRLYIFKDNKVVQRTLDHSVPQMLALTHEIEDKDIRHHEDRNIVLKVMGVEWESPCYDLMKKLPLKRCQAFLLCSDGFWELIEENDMCSMLERSSTPSEWLDLMVKAVRENGKSVHDMDNNSAIAVFVS